MNEQQFNAFRKQKGLSESDMLDFAKKSGYKVTHERQILSREAEKKQIIQSQKNEIKKNTGNSIWQGNNKNISKVKQVFKNVVGAAADSSSGISDLGLTLTSNAAERIAKQTGNEKLAERMDIAEKKTKEQLGDVGQDTEDVSYKASKLLFDLEQLIGGSSLVKAGTKGTKVGKLMGQLRNEMGLGGKVGAGVVEGLGETVAFQAISDGEVASGKELALGGAVGGLFPVIGAGLRKLGNLGFNAAFNQAKKSLGEKALQLNGKKAGELVQQEGLKGMSVSAMKKDLSKQLPKTRNAIEEAAKKKGPVNAAWLGNSLKDDIMETFGKINKNTEYYKSVKSNVDEVVDFYVGTEGKIQPDEVLELVGDLRTMIPETVVKKSKFVLNPKQSSSILKEMRTGIKKYMDDELGTLTGLYGDYGRQKLVEEILSNLEVRKMLGRSLLGGVIGAGTVSTDNFARGDIAGGLKEAVIGALVGGLLTRYSSDPDMLIKVAKTVDSLAAGAESAVGVAGALSELGDE